MDCTDVFHQIILKQSVQFHNIHQDFPYLFSSFSLLSWVTHDCQVIIHQISQKDNTTIYSFSHKPILIDRMKGKLYEFNKNYETYTIEYHLEPDPDKFTKNHPLKVSFHKMEEIGQEVIAVRIDDPSKILRQTFIPPLKEKLQHRRDALKQNQIIYYYIEPNNVRNQQCSEPHFSIAFQGGGAKGIAYIGAYKAIKETYPTRKLKSVIGSSAGGMLALAMCSGVKLDEIVEIVAGMDRIPKDKLIRDQNDLTEERKQHYSHIITQIRNFLHDYGIIHNKIFDIVKDEILTEDLIEEIFEYLIGENQSLKEMFTITVPHPKLQGFKKNKLTNIYGILEAKLMKGNQMLQISIKMLTGFLRNLLASDPTHFFNTLKLQPSQLQPNQYRQLSQSLTMQQFYLLTRQIQFTCTAVDLDSHVLRFFNHKTTPNLPVVKAVQMTGSFPVAFQAIKWQKEWGKYYIHYDRHRKEIDLTGHQFTDGGMLANFPIKYLDNQEMRPMYFAHKPNAVTTLFGFGLRELEEKEVVMTKEEEDRMEKVKNQKYQKLMKKIKGNVSYPRLALALARVPVSSQQVDPQKLSKPRDIPLVDFLLKLLQTYQNSNDNLVRQCFEYQTFFFNQKIKKLDAIESEKISSQIPNYKKLIDIVSELKDAIAHTDYSVQRTTEHLKSLRNVLSSGYSSGGTLASIKWVIKKGIINFSKYIKQKVVGLYRLDDEKYQQEIELMEKEHEHMLNELQSIGIIQVFSKSNRFRSDAVKLIGIIDKMNFLYLGKEREARLETEISRNLKDFFYHRKKKEITRLEKIQKMSKSYLELIHQTKEQNFPDMQPKLMKLIIQFRQKIGNPGMVAFKQFQKKLQQLKFKTLQIKKYLQDVKQSIQYYINWVFMSSKANQSDLHLVFQGLGVSMSYYFKAYCLVQDMIFQNESRKTREMSFNITKDILNNAKKVGDQSMFQNDGNLKYNLLKFVECNLQELDKMEEYELREKFRLIPDKDLKKRISKEIKKKITQKINSITCSNFHSILGFFIAAGFKQQRIEKQLMAVKYYTGVKNDIEKLFKSKDWTIPQRCTIRGIQDKIWANRFDLFKTLEKSCEKNETLAKDLENIKVEFERSKDIVVNGFEQVMDYLINIEIQSKKEKNPSEYIAKSLSLKHPLHNFYQENKKLSQGTQSLIYHLLDFFKEEIKFLIMSIYDQQPLIDMIITQKDPAKLEVMWKGLIIGGFYQGEKLKQKIQSVLEELNFPKSMTLRQFYQASPRKIKLNFMAVDMRSQRIYFINHNTFPYMPVWAAILITSSVPGFFPQIRCQPEWIQKISVSSRERTIKSFFTQKIPQYVPSFVSGNLLASFPLELLTNREVQLRYLFNENKETFLNFGILRLKKETSYRKFKRGYISLDDILSFALRLATKYLLGYQLTPSFNIAAIDEKVKILTTFINSHDNLIQDLYQNNTLMLPIRLGTLDFHKINKPLLLQKAIQQSCYITIQKLSLQKGTYFRIDLDGTVFNLKFFSRGNSQVGSSVINRTNLLYKHREQDQYTLLLEQDIQLDPYENEIWIQFFYVNDKKHIKQSVYKFNYADIVSKCLLYSGIFYLPYDSVLNQYKSPLNPPILTPKDSNFSSPLCLHIKSVVNFDQQGLFCLQCCQNLNPYPQSDFQKVYNWKLTNGICCCCLQTYSIRFKCKCGMKYCTLCTRDRLIIRKKNMLRCLRGHIFDFMNKHQATFRPRGFKFTLCDFCTEYTEAYYEDIQCNIHICEGCCAELLQK